MVYCRTTLPKTVRAVTFKSHWTSRKPQYYSTLQRTVKVSASSSSADTSTSAVDLIEESTLTNWRSPLGSLHRLPQETRDTDTVVALGKFDALHRGHRLLVEQAARIGGQPWLISFSGMAQELGWQERLPLVAPSERSAVLRSWAPFCSGTAPRLRCVPFAAVRKLSPRDFVASLAEDLQVSGVVVGNNYRFGFKAAGTVDTLQELGAEYGLGVRVMDLLGDASSAADTVSSSEVRQALADGRLAEIRQWLGRPYSVVIDIPETSPMPEGQEVLRVLQQCFMNEPPGIGIYGAVVSPAAEGAESRRLSYPVSMQVTKLKQALLFPATDSGWPPWISDARLLCVVF